MSGQCINLSGEASSGGLTGLKSAHSKSSVSASNGGDRTDGGVSKWHSSRGDEHGVAADGSPVQQRVMMDSRSGEGLQYVWQLDLPLEPTHKRRPAREFMGQGQNSQLHTELDFNQAIMVERKVPAYNRLKTDCVACRSVWLRTRMAGGVGAGELMPLATRFHLFWISHPPLRTQSLQIHSYSVLFFRSES